MKTFILSSQANKQFMTFCVLISFVWSILSTLLLLYGRYRPCEQAAPLILGTYESERWFNAEQTLDRRVIAENKWLSLSQHTVKIKEDQMIDDWLWIDTANQINVMVTTADDNGQEELFVIFEQTKYGYDGMSYAVVGGHIDPSDNGNGLKAAQRELMEEMGMQSDQWIEFGAFRTDVNRGAGFCHTFLARFAVQSKELQKYEDETEEMHIRHVPLSQLMQYYKQGLFKEAKWSNTVGLSIMYILENTKLRPPQEGSK